VKFDVVRSPHEAIVGWAGCEVIPWIDVCVLWTVNGNIFSTLPFLREEDDVGGVRPPHIM
jgi:hypothetical protein